jgi:hypothetical protein
VSQFSLRRLLLEGAERSKLTLGGNDLFHGGGAFRLLACGDCREPAGASGDLLRDVA